MAIYDDFKKKAKEALDTIADVSVEAYKAAEEKAKILARRARLNAEITRERALIRRIKIRIGDTYYNLHKDAPEEPLKKFCEDISASFDLIAGKQRELEELKKGNIVNEEEACECGDEECCATPEEAPEEAPEKEAEEAKDE